PTWAHPNAQSQRGSVEPRLPHVGVLTSASEDVIVDPSEAILERIDLDSWKWPEYFAFALTRMEEIFPTSGIPRGIGPVRAYVADENDFRSLAVDTEKWNAAEDSWSTVGDVLANTHTDAWRVTCNGIAVAEEYAWPMKPASTCCSPGASPSFEAVVRCERNESVSCGWIHRDSRRHIAVDPPAGDSAGRECV